MLKDLNSLLLYDDAIGLESLFENVSTAEADLSSILYDAIVHRSYQCLETLLKINRCDPYMPITRDGVRQPVLHHAIRLGDLHACKVLLDAGVHPLVCAGRCTDPTMARSPTRECEDAVRYALHGATESVRRNSIAVLLQTHLYSLVSAVVTACESGNCQQLARLLPDNLRLNCSVHVLANGQPLPSHKGSEERHNSTDWSPSTIGTFGSLGSTGLEISKRVLNATSERALSAVTSLGGLLFSTSSGVAGSAVAEKTQSFINLLTESDLIAWTRSCLSALPLICVQRGYLDCLSLLLKRGFRVERVARPLGFDCTARHTSSWTDHVPHCSVLVQQSVQQFTSNISQQARCWSEAPQGDADSAIHAAVRANRSGFLEQIIKLNPNAIRLSIPEPGIGALPVHTAAWWGRTECLAILLREVGPHLTEPIDGANGSNCSPRTGSTSGSESASAGAWPVYSCRVDDLPATYRFPFCLDQLDAYGLTPFLLAVLTGHVNIVRMLLQVKVPVQQISPFSHEDEPTPVAEDPLTMVEYVGASDSGCSIEDDDNLPPSVPTASTAVVAQCSEKAAPLSDLRETADHWVKVNSFRAVSCSVCPIDVNRHVRACWFPVGRVSAANTGVSQEQQRKQSIVIINPSECAMKHPDDLVVCGKFNALHLSIISGDLKLVELMLDYLLRDINVPVGPCMHLHENISPSMANQSPSEALTTSPLGLACRLACADEKLACQLSRLLISSGAFDPEQTLFYHAFQRRHFDLAGLLLTSQTSHPLSPTRAQANVHVNLSHKRLDRKYIPRPLWLLRHGPLTDWIHRPCLVANETPLPSLCDIGLAPAIRQQSFHTCLITRVSLSHCGLQLFPWCVLGDLPNLQELDVSWNHLGEFPLELPPLVHPVSDQGQTVDTWAPNLTYLDMSHNHLSLLPAWFFVSPIRAAQQSNRFARSLRAHRSTSSPGARLAHGYCGFAPKLTHLMLSHNRLHALPSEMWLSDGLQFLDLSWNLLTALPLPVWSDRRRMPFDQSSSLCYRSQSTVDVTDKFPVRIRTTASMADAAPTTSPRPSENFTPFRTPLDSVRVDLVRACSAYRAAPAEPEPPAVHSKCQTHPNRIRSRLVHLWIHHNCLTTLILQSTDDSPTPVEPRSHRPTLAQLAPRLEHLDASHNRIRLLPGCTYFPQSLVHLDLSNNIVTAWCDQPGPIATRDCTASCAQASTGRAEIRAQSAVKKASRSRDHARSTSSPRTPLEVQLIHGTETPMDLATLPRLEHLNLRGNRLESFCPTLDYYSSTASTMILDCPEKCTSWSSGPARFYHRPERTRFPSLRTLDLGSNPYLKSLAHSMCDLTQMQQLFLDGCTALTEIPAELWRLPKLHALYLDNTPFAGRHHTRSKGIPATAGLSRAPGGTKGRLPQNETRDILNEFRQVADSSRPFTDMNLVVLGSPGSGKSTLVRLMHSVEQSSDGDFRHSQSGHRVSGLGDQRCPPQPTVLEPHTDQISGNHLITSIEPHANRASSNSQANVAGFPVVRVTRLSVNRPVPLSSTGSTAATWCEHVSFRLWDVQTTSTHVRDAQSHVSVTEQCVSTDTLRCLQHLTYSRGSVFLVLWRMSDGVEGLNRATRWLMDIHAHTPSSPVILVGTHADQCHDADAPGWSPVRLTRPARASRTNLDCLSALVRTRFAGPADLAAFGLPNLFGHVVLNLLAETNTDLHRAIHGLLSLVHKAANSITVPSRVKSALALAATHGSGPCSSLLALPIPDLYHRGVTCFHQLAGEMHHASQPPILLVDRFLLEIDRRLRLLPHPSPVEFGKFQSTEEPLATQDVQNRPNPGSACPKSTFLTVRSRGFDSLDEARAFLTFLVEFGLVWYVDDPDLRHILFLSPVWLFQWLLGLLTDLSHRRSVSTAFIRRGRSSANLHTRSPTFNSTIITQTELLYLARSHLSEAKNSIKSGARSNHMSLLLRSLIPVMIKLELAVRLDTARILLPTLLSSRRVRTQCVVPAHPSLEAEKSVPELDTRRGMSDSQNGSSSCSKRPCQTMPSYENLVTTVPRKTTGSRTVCGPFEVRTMPGEEIVRVYATTYIPNGFWTRLASRLVADLTLDEICGRIYPLGTTLTGPRRPGSQGMNSKELSSVKQQAEWTLWRHGMRLSIADGRIGLARLQQFTRGPCALHRARWIARCFGEPPTPHQPRIRSGVRFDYQLDEWEELSATEGEELHAEEQYSAEPDLRTSDVLPRTSRSRHPTTQRTYRSGVVGAARNTYQGRKVRLLRWVSSSNAAAPVRNSTEMATDTGPPQASTNGQSAASFAFCNPGELVHEEYDGFETSCLIEIYVPCHWIVWPTVPMTSKLDSPDPDQNAPNLVQVNGWSTTSFDHVKPNREFTSKLLVKLVDHIDRLLEDWYPDLGTRLRQSNDGAYLVDRLIPCCMCLATAPGTPGQASPKGRRQSKNRLSKNFDFMPPMIKSQSSDDLAHKAVRVWDALDYPQPESGPSDAVHVLPAPSMRKQPKHAAQQELPPCVRRGLSSGQSPMISESDLVVGLYSTEHHLSVQHMDRPSRMAHGRLKRVLSRAHSAEALGPGSSLEQCDASSSVVYAISVREYLHWMTMHPDSHHQSSTGASDPRLSADVSRLCCPFHSTVPFQAPDLHFDDLSRSLRFDANAVNLLEFLGRGAFGSVFAGTLTVQQASLLNGPSNVDSVPVAVKLSTPIHPSLLGSQTPVTGEDCALAAATDDRLREALMLYRQEQRRWHHNSVEACCTAYHEIRTELNVLVQIGVGLSLRKFHSTKSRRNRSYHLQNVAGRLWKRSIDRRRHSPDQWTTDPIHPQHLLTCLGLVAPNPLGVLIALAPGGNLTQYLTRIREAVQLSRSVEQRPGLAKNTIEHPIHPITMMLIVHQLSSALAHLHSMNIVHRDVKLDNLLIWSMPAPPQSPRAIPSNSHGSMRTDPSTVSIVLTDYGASQFCCPMNGCRGYVGTPGYMAPEILRFLGEETYTEKVDVYSMGIIICELIKTEPAYRQCASTRFHLVQQVLSGQRPEIAERLVRSCPTHLLDLMALCWSGDPDLRPSAQVVSRLTAPWWQMVDAGSPTPPCPARLSLARPVRSKAEPNGLCHINSVHRIRSMDVVTCAALDDSGNLWFGGYRFTDSNDHKPINPAKVSSKRPASDIGYKEGLLVRTRVPRSENFKLHLIDHFRPADWPLGWSRVKQTPMSSNDMSTNALSRSSRLLPEAVAYQPEWPQQLCPVRVSVAANEPLLLMHCLTSVGDLVAYDSNPQARCLMRTRLKPCSAIAHTPSVPGRPLLLSLNHEPVVGTETMCTGSACGSKIAAHYRLLCVLQPGVVGLLGLTWTTKVLPESSHIHGQNEDRVRLVYTSWIPVANHQHDIHCGVVVFDGACSSLQVWFGQSRGSLACYSVDHVPHNSTSHHPQEMRSTNKAIRYLVSWPATPAPTNQSIVSALLVSGPIEMNDSFGTTTVWSCLCPEQELTCWSVLSQSALRTICFSDIPIAPTHLAGPGSSLPAHVTCMQWLTASSLLLLNSRGHLLYIRLSTQQQTPSSARMFLFRLHHERGSNESVSHLTVATGLHAPAHIYTLGPGFRHPLRQLLSATCEVSECNSTPHLVELFSDDFLFP